MDDVELVYVVYPRNDLLEELASFFFLQSGVGNDVVEQLSSTCVLHYQIQLLGSFDNLIKLDDVRMPDELKDMDLSSHSFHVRDISNPVFL